MIEIQKSSSISERINRHLLSKAISTTLDILKKPEMEITLRLIDDEEMTVLNQTFRGEDKTTDVLSFNQDILNPETGQTYLGDILISVPTAARQTANQGHSLDLECAFLAVHGTLHLLGYDHDDARGKAEMWALQDKIFNAVKSNREENQP
jgi:probable rRNA maturation factor